MDLPVLGTGNQEEELLGRKEQRRAVLTAKQTAAEDSKVAQSRSRSPGGKSSGETSKGGLVEIMKKKEP